MEKKVEINGMKCSGCVETVKTAFESIEGIKEVTVDLKNKQATIESQRTITNDELQQALIDTKFTVNN